jgi:hypothetical protein
MTEAEVAAKSSRAKKGMQKVRQDDGGKIMDDLGRLTASEARWRL